MHDTLTTNHLLIMARIVGVDLNDDWKVDYALTNIKGIGWTLSEQILDRAGIKKDTLLKDLNKDDIAKLASLIEEHPVEGDLLRQVRSNVQRLKTIGSYRGVRHNRGLPVRGQRTKTNARTKRGKRKTVGAFRKEALSKMQQGQPRSKKEEE